MRSGLSCRKLLISLPPDPVRSSVSNHLLAYPSSRVPANYPRLPRPPNPARSFRTPPATSRSDRLDAASVHDFCGLVAVAGDADDDRFVAIDGAALDQLARRRHRHAAGRLGEDPFGLRSSWMPSMISSSVTIAPSRPSIARSAAPGSRRPDCRWRSTWRWCRASPVPEFQAGLERADHRRAAGGLGRVDRRQLASTSPTSRSSVNPLRMRGQQRAAGDRRDDVAREAPAELFCNLEAVGLGAFGVVGAQVDVGESPLIPIRDLRAQPVHVVVVATHGDDARLVDRAPVTLPGSRLSGMKTEQARPSLRHATRRCWRGCRSRRRRTR